MSELRTFLLLTSLLATCYASPRKLGPQASPSPSAASSPGVVSTAGGGGNSHVFGEGGQTQTLGSVLTEATKAPAGGFALSNVYLGAASESQGITNGRVISTTGVANQTPGYHNAAGGESQVEFFGVKNTQATATTANNGIADANGGWNEIQGVSTASGESIVRSGMAFKSYSEGR